MMDPLPSLMGDGGGRLTWTTREGQAIAVDDMTDLHVHNAVAMLRRNGRQVSDSDDDRVVLKDWLQRRIQLRIEMAEGYFLLNQLVEELEKWKVQS